jgi:hypothetical protein
MSLSELLEELAAGTLDVLGIAHSNHLGKLLIVQLVKINF